MTSISQGGSSGPSSGAAGLVAVASNSIDQSTLSVPPALPESVRAKSTRNSATHGEAAANDTQSPPNPTACEMSKLVATLSSAPLDATSTSAPLEGSTPV